MMPGISIHIDSSENSVRRLGMIVGEVLTSKLDLEGKQKLDFEYNQDEESDLLVRLAIRDDMPPEEFFNSILERYNLMKESLLDKLKTHETTEGKLKTYTTTKGMFLKISPRGQQSKGNDGGNKSKSTEVGGRDEISNENETHLDSDDSSDDDFQPYDMSGDNVHSKTKRPIYVRDCLEGILQSDDRELMEACLSSARTLIEKNPIAANEVSVEFCKALLLLEDSFELDNFTVWRHSAMVSLAVVDPERVAGYLTSEFYEENYTLSRRLDMLDVLSAAAGALSSIERVAEKSMTSDEQKIKRSPNPGDTKQSWREIVDKRIESKTRRFGKFKRKATIPASANRFGPVAGYFFYPLLAGYDKRIRTMDLLGRDSLVLGRLLYCVGTIVYSATNTMAVASMARFLIEFVLELRYHQEAYVRQAALFCASMATISAGNALAGSDIMFEVNDWIGDVMANDPNYRTKELATQTYMVISSTFAKNLK